MNEMPAKFRIYLGALLECVLVTPPIVTGLTGTDSIWPSPGPTACFVQRCLQ